jgi:DNA-binding MarR family transcriptional regulator
MTPALRDELRQRKPFRSLHQEAFLSLSRTQTVLTAALERMLEPHEVTLTQYNVLRILRGAGTDGLCRNEIGERLVARTPDVTRLLDRMETAGLVSRERDETDRRLVLTRLTRKGRALVDSLDEPVAAEHHRRLGHMSREQLQTLVDLLGSAREHARD